MMVWRILLVLLFPVALWAQTGTLQGRVTDMAGAPLAAANVVVVELTQGDVVASDGTYEIARLPAGTYTVRASLLGFRASEQTVTISANATTTLDFQLAEITLQSDAVIVTAARREQRSQTAPITIEVMAPEALTARNAYSLDTALRHIPGVQVLDNTVSVRGSTGFVYGIGSRVLLLVDGLPMLGPGQENIELNALPMPQIDRIEVVKGPGSALYGTGALGGVINLITKDFPDVPETRVRLFGGGYEPVRYTEWRQHWSEAESARLFGGGSIAHAQKLSDKLAFWANVSYRQDQAFLERARQEHMQGYGKIRWQIDPDRKLELFGGLTQGDNQSYIFWTSAQDALTAFRSDFARGFSHNRTIQANVAPIFTRVVNPKFFYTVKGRYFYSIIKPVDAVGRTRPDTSHTVGNRYGFETQFNYKPSESSYLTSGFSADFLRAKAWIFRGNDNQWVRAQPEGALFAQVEHTFNPQWTVIAGGRFDLYQISETETLTKLSPKLNLSFTPHPVMTLRASWGLGFRIPSVAERFVNDTATLPVIPNPSVRPEESVGYEIGFRSLFPLGAEAGGMIDISAFWNDYTNLVDPQFQADANAFQFVNVTEARVRGLEAKIFTEFGRGQYSLQASYMYLDAKDLTLDMPLIYRSRHTVQMTGTAQLGRGFDVGADFRYLSIPDRFDSEFSRFVRDADLMVPIRVLDLRVGTTWRGWRAALLLNNALEYYYLERAAKLAPPRHLILQVETTF